MNSRPKTLFIDIDGTLLHHFGSGNAQSVTLPSLLPGVREKLDEWDRKGYRFILVTGRRESERKATEAQLSLLNIVYDMLIMGIGGGDRIVINDLKPNSDRETAGHICIPRNVGLVGIDL